MSLTVFSTLYRSICKTVPELTNLKLNEESIILSPERWASSGVLHAHYSSCSAVSQDPAFWKEGERGVCKMNNTLGSTGRTVPLQINQKVQHVCHRKMCLSYYLGVEFTT